jgi:hypothetical protein
MKRILVAASALVLLTATPAWTQTSDSPAAPTARQLSLAREMVEISGSRNVMTTMFNAMLNQMVPEADPHSASAEDRKVHDIALEAAHAAFEKATPKMLDLFVDTYAHDFSEQEMSDIVAFYKTPSGQAAIAKLPKVMAESMPVVRNTIVPQLQRDMVDEICNRLACTPAMHAAILDRMRTSQH